MKKYLYLLLTGWGLLLAAPASAKVNIFACSPEWASLSKEIGGDFVEIYTATKAHQDAHYMRAKPSLVAAMRKADLVFCSGAALESGWLPIFLQKAGGPDVQQNTLGWLMASDFVPKLNVMKSVDRSMGHVHPEGNPHVHLNPHNISEIANVLAERLFLIDRENGDAYESNLDNFQRQWKSNIQSWEYKAENLASQNVVVYHKSWDYLTDWLDMNVIASLEPKPGLPPTTSHLEDLLQNLKDADVVAILVAPYENDKAAKWLSERTGIPVLNLPFTIGGSDQAQDLQSLFNETLMLLDESSK